MSDGTDRDPDPDAPPDLAALARDWITLWQSELAALAADREAQEMSQAVLDLWAGMAGSLLAAMPRARPAGTDGGASGGFGAGFAASPGPGPSARHERADGRSGAAAPAGAAADPAAPGAGDAALERLHRRLAELESRLAELESDGAAPRRRGRGRVSGGGRAKPRRPSA